MTILDIVNRHYEDLHDPTNVLQVSLAEIKECPICNQEDEVKMIDITPDTTWVLDTTKLMYAESAEKGRNFFFAAYPSLTEEFFVACIEGRLKQGATKNSLVMFDD